MENQLCNRQDIPQLSSSEFYEDTSEEAIKKEANDPFESLVDVNEIKNEQNECDISGIKVEQTEHSSHEINEDKLNYSNYEVKEENSDCIADHEVKQEECHDFEDPFREHGPHLWPENASIYPPPDLAPDWVIFICKIEILSRNFI